jgi:hypothetical protein
MSKPVYCQHHLLEVNCGKCLTSGAWDILRASSDLRKAGHSRAISWARVYLGLENRDEVKGARAVWDDERQE